MDRWRDSATAGSSGIGKRRLASSGALLAIVAITLVAFSSRGSFTAVGPLLRPLEDELGISPSGGAALVALPLACFGLLALVVPRLSAHVGLHRAMSLGIALLACGVLLRAGGVVGFFVGTVLVGSGIALLNVLLPAVTKADFPHRWALLTALVTTAMTLSASLGAGLARPLVSATGTAEGSLLLWLVPIGVAGVLWIPVARSRHSGVRLAVPTSIGPILRDRVGLGVALFFGLQTLTFYTFLTWLPSILVDLGGVTPARAGALVAIGTALGVPAALALPPLVGRQPSQVLWVLTFTAITACATVGLAIAPAWSPELWTMMWGLANGATFPVAMSLVQLRTRTGIQAGRLAAASQFTGYLLAAVGPLSVGLLIDATGSWVPCFVLLSCVLIAQVAAGVVAARPRLMAAD